VAYTHYDAYPRGLGIAVLKFCMETTDWAALRQSASDLVVIDDLGTPTDEQLKQLKQLAGRWGRWYSGEGASWYAHLAETQGELALILAAGFIAYPGREAVRGRADMSIDWSYIVDLDEHEFRVYRGTLAGDLVGSWPLDRLPDYETFVALDT
jgi:hypothetical protein